MKKLRSNPWMIGIGSSVFAVLIIRLIDFINGTKILKAIWETIKYCGAYFTTDVQIPVYALIIIFISGPLIIIVVLGLFSHKNQHSWLNYNEDIFEGVFYRWEYYKRYDGKYDIKNIIPFCTKCECQLVGDRCPNCKTSYYNKTKSNHELKPLILHTAEKVFNNK